MRKFFTALVLIPLGLVFIVFAVANRHLVTVSFDPFNSTDPSVAVTLPLFAVIIVVAIAAGGARRGSTRPMHGRRGRNWPICAPVPRPRKPARSAFRRWRRAADRGPAGETSWARRCRTRPNPPCFWLPGRRPNPCPETCP
jgi:uncharacterized integral membrane protein